MDITLCHYIELGTQVYILNVDLHINIIYMECIHVWKASIQGLSVAQVVTMHSGDDYPCHYYSYTI